MAKKRASSRTRRRTAADPLQTAAEAVAEAQATLAQAEAEYEQMRQQTDDADSTEATLADLIDATLALVRRYPGAGIFVSGAIGLLLGRASRR